MSINELSSYLNSAVPNDQKISFKNQRIEKALEILNRDIETLYNQISEEPATPEIKEKLTSLKDQVNTEVRDYHSRHNGVYFFFRKLFYKDIDQISHTLVANIERLETKLNPILNQHLTKANLLPLPSDVMTLISQNLNANDLANLTKTAKAGKEAVQEASVLKAREFGYEGYDKEGAEKYWQAIGRAVLKLDQEKNENGEIDIEKTLLKYAGNDAALSNLCYANVDFMLFMHRIDENDFEALAQCLLYLKAGIHGKSTTFYYRGGEIIFMFERALKTGKLKGFELLLNQSTLYQVYYFEGKNGFKTLLEHAVEAQNVPMVNLLIKYQANPRIWAKEPPLHLAIKSGNLEIGKLLLDPKFKAINLLGANAQTSLHLAISLNRTEFIPLLHANGDDFNMALAQWLPPLHKATANVEMLKLIHENGADINLVKKNSALRWAFHMKRPEAVKYLLEAGADRENPHENGTALIWACNEKMFDIAKQLLEEESDPNHIGPDEIFPLAQVNSTEGLKLLIKAGAELDIEAENGDTPLIQAIREHNWGQVDRLITLGADVNHINKNGQTALDLFSGMDRFRLKLRGAKYAADLSA